MNRNSYVIFGVLIFAFVIYITTRGQLPAYLATLGLAPKSNLTGIAGNTTGSPGASPSAAAPSGQSILDQGQSFLDKFMNSLNVPIGSILKYWGLAPNTTGSTPGTAPPSSIIPQSPLVQSPLADFASIGL